MSRAFGKTTKRMFLSNKGRFIACFATVFFSVAIASGLGALPRTFADSYGGDLKVGLAPDLIVKSKRASGFLPSELETATNFANVADSQSFFQVDLQETDGTYNRIYILDFEVAHLAKPEAVEGVLPKAKGEVAVEKGNRNRRDHAVGEIVTLTSGGTLFPKELAVTSVVVSPLYKSVVRERAEIEDLDDVQYVDRVFYLSKASMPKALSSLTNTLYLKLNVDGDLFGDQYKNSVEAIKNRLLQTLGENRVSILTLDENTSFATFKNYNEKVRLISYVFPAFFVAVCALIVHITITRLIKDDRAKIACCSSIGISKGKIVLKYLSFIFSSVALGGAAGYLAGAPFLPTLVKGAYSAVFRFGANVSFTFWAPIGVITLGFLVGVSVLISVYSSISYLKEEPGDLMRDKAPMPGKKILLERIPFIWKRLSFSMKSSLRNIFRQKKNMILTSLSVGGSTLLLLAGFSLLNVSDALRGDELFGDVASSMGLISTVIVLLAVSITIPILYSLANMNIEDRKRELATLKVLGYHNIECSNYTFREIIMISVFAGIISLPISALIIDFVLKFIGFGSLADVQWWSYLCAFAIIIATTVAVNYILFPRIRKIDPNVSLKTME